MKVKNQIGEFDLTKEKYETMQKQEGFANGTRIGKAGITQFLTGLKQRMEASENDYDKWSTRAKYADAAYYFFKWVMEKKDFDCKANPKVNCLIAQVGFVQNRYLRLSHNLLCPMTNRSYRALIKAHYIAMKSYIQLFWRMKRHEIYHHCAVFINTHFPTVLNVYRFVSKH